MPDFIGMPIAKNVKAQAYYSRPPGGSSDHVTCACRCRVWVSCWKPETLKDQPRDAQLEPWQAGNHARGLEAWGFNIGAFAGECCI